MRGTPRVPADMGCVPVRGGLLEASLVPLLNPAEGYHYRQATSGSVKVGPSWHHPYLFLGSERQQQRSAAVAAKKARDK